MLHLLIPVNIQVLNVAHWDIGNWHLLATRDHLNACTIIELLTVVASKIEPKRPPYKDKLQTKPDTDNGLSHWVRRWPRPLWWHIKTTCQLLTRDITVLFNDTLFCLLVDTVLWGHIKSSMRYAICVIKYHVKAYMHLGSCELISSQKNIEYGPYFINELCNTDLNIDFSIVIISSRLSCHIVAQIYISGTSSSSTGCWDTVERPRADWVDGRCIFYEKAHTYTNKATRYQAHTWIINCQIKWSRQFTTFRLLLSDFFWSSRDLFNNIDCSRRMPSYSGNINNLKETYDTFKWRTNTHEIACVFVCMFRNLNVPIIHYYWQASVTSSVTLYASSMLSDTSIVQHSKN
jgi:hypothetical protein